MPDIEISKIVLRRGPAFDLPGKPVKLNPRQWTRPLDEGEVAFASDQGRMFIGADPAKDMKQSQRLQFPYQNVEVIGENSVDAFADLHGERMREGDLHDYYSAPMYPTAKPSSQQEPDRFVLENMVGYARYGVEQGPPLIQGDGVPATRAVDASVATLAVNGTGTLSSPTRFVVANDFTRNRLITLSHGTDGDDYVHTVEVRDTYGSILSSYAVADVGGGHNALFTPSVYTADGKLAGVIATKFMSGLGIYDEIGNPISIPVVVYGLYNPGDNETLITDTVALPGNVTVNLGPVTYNGVTYYCFGNGDVSVGTVGNFVMASCAPHNSQSTDPASFLVFGTDGSYKSKITMPAAYSDRTVYGWVKAGSRTIALVRPNANPAQTHFLVFTDAGSNVNMTIVNPFDAITQSLTQYGEPQIDYVAYVPNDDSLVCFSNVSLTLFGDAGRYYSVTKLKLSDYTAAWTHVSTFITAFLPQISDDLFRSPVGNDSVTKTFADRLLGNTFKWATDIGFHEVDLSTGVVRSAGWGETSVAAPSSTEINYATFFYDEAQDRIIFGGGGFADTKQYTVHNNSTAATGTVTVSFTGPNFVYGGDEFTGKLAEVLSPNSQKSYIVNVSANRWIGVYDASTLAWVAGWDGGGTLTLGGSIIPCTGGRAFFPLQDGRMVRLSITNTGQYSFAVVPCVEASNSGFGVIGMYFHDSSDNSIVVIGGPENDTTDARSFKWMIDTNTIKWSRAYSGPFATGETDNEDGLPNIPPNASQMVNGGYIGWINTYGGVSLIDLSNGTRLYKGMAETTTGFDSTTPTGFSQWAWDSSTNSLVYMNTTSGFSYSSGTLDEALAAYTGQEAYLSNTVNHGIDLIKIRFKRNTQGIWSTEVTRPDANSFDEKLPPDMRLWADFQNRFVYAVSNNYLKCYDLDTLQLVATTQSGLGRSFLKVWGSNLTGKLYVQLGSHNGGRSGDGGLVYDDASQYQGRMNGYMTYTPLQCVNLFGRHIPQGVTWKDVLVDGDPTRPYEVKDIASVNAFIDYTVNNQQGHRIRYGHQQLQYFYNPLVLPGEVGSDAKPSMIDEAEQLVRVIEQDPDYHPEYDPSQTVGQLGFRYILVDENVDQPVLRFQYRNYSTETLSIEWKVSRPQFTLPIRGPRGFADLLPLGMTAYIKMDHELVVFVDYQPDNLDLWTPEPPYERFIVTDPMSFWDHQTYTDAVSDYERMFLYSNPGAPAEVAQQQVDNQISAYNPQSDTQIRQMIGVFASNAGFNNGHYANYQAFLDEGLGKSHSELVECVVGVFLYFITGLMYQNLASSMRKVDRITQQINGATPGETGIQSLSKIQVQTRTIVTNSEASTGGTESIIRGVISNFAQLDQQNPSPIGIAADEPLFGVPAGVREEWTNYSGGDYAGAQYSPGLVNYYLNQSPGGQLVETTDRATQLNLNIFSGYGAVPFSVGEGHILVSNGSDVHAWIWATEVCAVSPNEWPEQMQVSLYRPSDFGLIRSLTMANSITPLLDTDDVTVLGYLNVMRDIVAVENAQNTANPHNGEFKLLAETGTNSYIMAIRVPDGTVHARPEKPFPGWFWKIVVRVARSDATQGISKSVKSETNGIGGSTTDMFWQQTGEWEWTAYGYNDFATNYSAHITLQMGANFFNGIALLSSPDAQSYDNGNPRPRIYITTQYWNGQPVNVSNPAWCVGKQFAYDYDYLLKKS